MKNLKNGAVALVLIAAASLSACKKDNTSPSTTPQMSFELKGINPSVSLTATHAANGLLTNSSAASSVTWTAGIANISKFKFEAKKGGTEIEVTSSNLANVDLFALSPVVSSITLNPGTYTEIEVKVLLVHSDNPDSMPLKLSGTFTNSSSVAIPIEFDFNSDATIKAEAENVTVTAGMDYSSLIQMHLDKLLKGISAADLEAATQTSGTIVISQSSNTALYNLILANVATSCDNHFGEHHHGEGNDDKGNHGGNDDGSNHN